MGLLKEKDIRIAFIVMAAIIASIAISVSVFHKDPSPVLSVVGFFFLVCLPWYVVYRTRSNRNEDAAKYEIERTVDEYVEELEALAKDIKEYNCEKESPTEFLESVEVGIEDITDGLRDLQYLMKNYGFAYDIIQRRNAIAKLQEKGKVITNATIEEELKKRN